MYAMFSGSRCRAALSLLVALVAAGCGSSQASGEAAEIASPQRLEGTGVVSEVVSPEAAAGDEAEGIVGDGQTLPGTELEFGEAATLAMSSSGKRGVVSATVEVTRGDPADVAGLDGVDGVDGDPYYVNITFENVGENEMPYASLDNDFRGRLSDGSPARQPGTPAGFRACEAVPAPADFREGKSYESCRVFVVPAGERVRSVAYEGFETPYADDPVVWRP